ncbi:NADP-dependent malic enzyme [Longimicrobium sp.]|uniref:NADP-dependent malic enzyme n=1 Tax=Longimicrobium sp. TaxID=2029185 RepID=UPI002E32C354|nr:NADP-dependent malic enzyme [Longimicrobium sp.]HEX6040314.1 NADP-dependent malic enzyme [Longimicrobium sp.]
MSFNRQDALDYHSEGRRGKIAVVPTKPASTQRDLSLAYSPGVAEPCREIAQNPEDVFKYTARGNLVAVVSNGTAVLGLGDIGPLAAKPVMEGKGVLFKRFADIDVFDLEVGSKDPDDVIRFCELLEPTVGGINLEDIGAPECFYIEETLKERLDIPVFHDDQHGTAVISGAALLNALDISGKKIDELTCVFSGAGAAAIATAELYISLGVRRENIVMTDSKGVIRSDRGTLDKYKGRFATDRDLHTLADAMVGADLFVGLSVAGAVTQEMVASMAEAPIVFALANPDPEILPEDVLAVRPDAMVATGRTDYPNQINNVLGFPFIFRGALDVRARAINDEMKMAACRALAELARLDVPESVEKAYGNERFRFGAEYLIPKPFDPRIMLYVAPAVAQAAMETGVARVQIDVEHYRAELIARLGRGREVMRDIMRRARQSPRRIVYPEGENERIIRACALVLGEGIARPVLVGRPEVIRDRAHTLGVSIDGAEIVDLWGDEARRETYAQEFFRRRQRKGVTLAQARERMREPVFFGCMMVLQGDADGLLAGEDMYYPETIRPALEVIGTAPGVRRVAGLYMMVLEREMIFFADTTVNIDPDAGTLAETALLAADFVRRLGLVPRVAMLSFSNFGSVRSPQSDKVRAAAELVKQRAPGLEIDGEMQADTAAMDEFRLDLYPFTSLRGRPNIYIFPNLDAANAAYKLMWRMGGAEAFGPILLGMGHPIHVLQRGSEAVDVLNLTALAVVDAQEHAGRHAGG